MKLDVQSDTQASVNKLFKFLGLLTTIALGTYPFDGHTSCEPTIISVERFSSKTTFSAHSRLLVWKPLEGNQSIGENEKRYLALGLEVIARLAGARNHQISPTDSNGKKILATHSLTEFEKNLELQIAELNRIEPAHDATQPKEITIVLDSHGNLEHGRMMGLPTGVTPKSSVPFLEFLEVIYRKAAQYPSFEANGRINLLVQSCYAGQCGLEASVFARAQKSRLNLTVVGLSGFRQWAFPNEFSNLLKGVTTIDDRLRSRGVDLCPGCHWFERIARLIGGFPRWISDDGNEAGSFTVHGRPIVTSALNYREFFEVVRELIFYAQGDRLLFAAGEFLHEKMRIEKEKNEIRRTLENSVELRGDPFINFVMHLADKKLGSAIDYLIQAHQSGKLNHSDYKDSLIFSLAELLASPALLERSYHLPLAFWLNTNQTRGLEKMLNEFAEYKLKIKI